MRDLEQLATRLDEAGALVGASDHAVTKSLYGRDPDGLEFEIARVVPADLLDEAALARPRSRALDLRAAIERFGADTTGGYGISRAVAALN